MTKWTIGIPTGSAVCVSVYMGMLKVRFRLLVPSKPCFCCCLLPERRYDIVTPWLWKETYHDREDHLRTPVRKSATVAAG